VFINLKKVKKKKLINILVVESSSTSIVYLSPLTNPFIFNPSFSILPNLVNSNIPISFP
jgi:hypothetical protein